MAGTDGCEHCGRRLPGRNGPGRRRRYCDATCRSAARRDRARHAESVKPPLTVDRDQVADVSDPLRRLAASLSISDGAAPLDAISAARDLSRAVERVMREAVQRARDAGHSWQEIGE